MSKDTSWGKVSEWYDDVVNDTDSFQSQVILPHMMRLVAPHKGQNILDVACGQGFFSKAMEVSNVVGVDIGGELINIAKKNVKGHFFTSPSHKLDMVKDETVDIAICVLALQNIEKLNETVAEVKKKLVKNGRFIIVLNHPAFRIPKKTSWGWDGEAQYRRVDAYMSESSTEIDMTPGKEEDKINTVSFHRPLQVYFKAFNKAGFAVAKLEEWISHKVSQDGPKKAEEDRMRKEIPMFMCLVCVPNSETKV
jgi:ubiquinone/menaquinone biosynthesis C-methylase UbiE